MDEDFVRIILHIFENNVILLCFKLFVRFAGYNENEAANVL